MKLQRIVEAVYCQPWLITAQSHASIRMIVESKLAGEALRSGDFKWGETDFEGNPLPKMSIQGNIAIIPVKGVIVKGASGMEKTCGAVSPEDISRDFAEAMDNPRVRGVMLDINSPGGYVTGIHELATQIADARGKKPVMAYTDELIASAAYYLCAGATQIDCSPSAHVGSIGTYAYILDSSEQFKQRGIKPMAIVSEGSDLKAAGLPGIAWTEKQIAELQRTVDRSNDRFKTHVSANRPSVKDDAMRGQCVDGIEAQELGLVDSLSTFQQAFEALLRLK